MARVQNSTIRVDSACRANSTNSIPLSLDSIFEMNKNELFDIQPSAGTTSLSGPFPRAWIDAFSRTTMLKIDLLVITFAGDQAMRLVTGLVLTGFSVLAVPSGPGSSLDFVYAGLFIAGAALIITSSHDDSAKMQDNKDNSRQ